MPFSCTDIGVGGKLQIICPGFCTNTDAAVFACEIVIKKDISAKHPFVGVESSYTHADIAGRAPVGSSQTKLGKQHCVFIVIQRGKEIDGAFVPVAAVVNVELNARGTELAEPLLSR